MSSSLMQCDTDPSGSNAVKLWKMSLYSSHSLVHRVLAGSSPADSAVVAVAPIAMAAASATYYSNTAQVVQHYLRTMFTSAYALHNSTRAVECDGTHVTTTLPMFTVNIYQSITRLMSHNYGIPNTIRLGNTSRT